MIPKPGETITLNLEDHGQDFYYFEVRDKTIIKAGPYQGWVWEGKKLVNDGFEPGTVLQFEDGRTLNYPVESVAPTPNAETQAAMLAARSGDVARFDNVADLMADLNSTTDEGAGI